ncbi:MAG: hypothetical protein ACON39_03790 [Coraliomargaritaceae bacterium]
MKNTINSPIVITVIVIISLFVLKSQMNSRLGSELRGVYEELIAIAEDASSDVEKTKAIQDFSEQISRQIKEGFSIGLSSNGNEKEESRDSKILRVKKEIKLLEIQELPSAYDNRQSFYCTIKNESEFPIKSLRINYDYFREGALIDTENDWLSEIAVLDVQESVNIKHTRNLPSKFTDEEKTAFTFDQVKASVTSFQIIED